MRALPLLVPLLLLTTCGSAYTGVGQDERPDQRSSDAVAASPCPAEMADAEEAVATPPDPVVALPASTGTPPTAEEIERREEILRGVNRPPGPSTEDLPRPVPPGPDPEIAAPTSGEGVAAESVAAPPEPRVAAPTVRRQPPTAEEIERLEEVLRGVNRPPGPSTDLAPPAGPPGPGSETVAGGRSGPC